MDKEMAKRILNRLSVWYPKNFNVSNMTSDQKEFFARDLVSSFAPYKSEAVSDAYNDYHLDHKFAPTVADIREILQRRPTARINYKPPMEGRRDIPEGWRVVNDYQPCDGCKDKEPGCEKTCTEYGKRGMPCAIPPAGWWASQNNKETEKKD